MFFQLALYIWNKGEGVKVTEVEELCAGDTHDNCVTSYTADFPDCVSNLSCTCVIYRATF